MSQLVVNILVAASLNLLLALSFYPGYHTTRFFNLSHAFLPTCAAYALLLATSTLKLPLSLGVVLALLAAVAAAVLLQTALFAPLWRRGLAGWQLLVVSLGGYIVLVNIISMLFGDEMRTLGLSSTRRTIFGAYISDVRLATILTAFLGFGFMVFLLRRTALGKAIRAVGSDVALAETVGVLPARTAAWAVGFGGLYAGAAGILVGLDTDVTPGMGFQLLLNGVVVMILAGVGNTRGLVGGALLLAAGQDVVAYFISSQWMNAVTYLILIGFLIWKPLGFSGRRLKKVEI
jgi:branched-subunit amino acid ABC-type transport system permease component